MGKMLAWIKEHPYISAFIVFAIGVLLVMGFMGGNEESGQELAYSPVQTPVDNTAVQTAQIQANAMNKQTEAAIAVATLNADALKVQSANALQYGLAATSANVKNVASNNATKVKVTQSNNSAKKYVAAKATETAVKTASIVAARDKYVVKAATTSQVKMVNKQATVALKQQELEREKARLEKNQNQYNIHHILQANRDNIGGAIKIASMQKEVVNSNNAADVAIAGLITGSGYGAAVGANLPSY